MTKAILTMYHGPINSKGSRITALDEEGNQITVSYPHELPPEDAHRRAAHALQEEMRWTGNLTASTAYSGYVFVLGPDWSACVRASNRIADLACAIHATGDDEVRKVYPIATMAEIIAQELGVEVRGL